jgi:phage/plasmid-associated DNA primase
MKIETMREQLPNPIRFIIDHIGSWAENSIVKTGRTLLYQKYLEWCGDNGEKPFSNNIFGKKLSEKNIIECKQGRVGGGKREWQYILDRPKIIAKLCESGLGDIEEFSDIPQPDLPENETADIPIFNVPEIIPPKITPLQPEENLPPRDKEEDKQEDSAQAPFDYVAEKAEPQSPQHLGHPRLLIHLKVTIF